MPSSAAVRSCPLRFDPLRDKTYQSSGLGRPIVDYLARKTNQGRSPRTLEDKERYLANLACLFPELGVGDFTPQLIDHWLATQPAGSRRHRLSHVNDFFRWAVRFDLRPDNPVDKLDPIARPVQSTYDIFLEPEILQLTSMPFPDGPLMLAMFDAGLRKGEARRLQGQHVIPEPIPGQLRITNGKGGKQRIIPLTLRLSQALSELALLEAIGPKDFFWYTRARRRQDPTRQRTRRNQLRGLVETLPRRRRRPAPQPAHDPAHVRDPVSPRRRTSRDVVDGDGPHVDQNHVRPVRPPRHPRHSLRHRPPRGLAVPCFPYTQQPRKQTLLLFTNPLQNRGLKARTGSNRCNRRHALIRRYGTDVTHGNDGSDDPRPAMGDGHHRPLHQHRGCPVHDRRRARLPRKADAPHDRPGQPRTRTGTGLQPPARARSCTGRCPGPNATNGASCPAAGQCAEPWAPHPFGQHWLENAFQCIHQHEGVWRDGGLPYFGGLQMDLDFQRAYGRDYLRYFGTADRWPVSVQLAVAIRGYISRGFQPWPNTRRMCGL